jgi:tetratricopeptide (TPR) repeat protein
MISTDSLAQAKAILRRDPVRAQRLAELACRDQPSDEAVLLLASARRRCGDAAGAVALLGPLATKLPQAWGVHFELGLALGATGKVTDAIAALQHARERNPRSLLAAHALRDLVTVSGQLPAEDRLGGAMADPALHASVAAALQGDEASSERLGTRFGLEIGDIAGACLIADIGMKLGLHEAVASLLRTALVNAPAYLPALLRQAEALHRSGADSAALPVVDRVLLALPDLVAALTLRAAILISLARETEAVAELVRASALAYDDARVWQSYGHALRAVGCRDEALAAYRTAIRTDPSFGEAYWSIADMKTGALTPVEIDDMEALASDGSIGTEARSFLHFALGRAHEDRGDAEAAFLHYRRANASRRPTAQHDADAHDAFVRRVSETFDAAFFADRAGSGIDTHAPIFVLGMPRSGSSLVEQILASHPEIEGASELPDITNIARALAMGMAYPDDLTSCPLDTFATAGSDYLERTRCRRHTGRPHFVDKFPGNWLHIGLIHLMLPNARIIDVRRDARDCCFSLFSQSFAAGQGYSYDLADLGRYYNGYVALMRHFDRVLPGRVLRVNYEALVDDIEGETRRLLGHCGLAFDPACLRFFDATRAVRTASSEQVRSPLYRSSIGRWRRFEAWLGPLFEALDGDWVTGARRADDNIG